MRARDMTLGSELDRVELPGPPSKGSLDSPSKVLPTAPNSNSAGDDWELASILRAGGQVTSADLGTLHKSFKLEIAPCGSFVRLRPTFVYKEKHWCVSSGRWVHYTGALWAAGNKANVTDGAGVIFLVPVPVLWGPCAERLGGSGQSTWKSCQLAVTHIWWLTQSLKL